MKLSSKSIHSRLIKHLREWHRKLGIIAAFFIIFLSISGIALNHTTTLSLAHQPISNTWLLDYYGIASPSDVRFYQQGSLRVTNNILWLNDKLLLESNNTIIAAALMASTESLHLNTVLVASSDQLYLFNQNGELIDQLGEEVGLPQNISAMSIANQSVVINTSTGYYHSSNDLFEWKKTNFVIEPNWIKPSKATKKVIAKVILAYRAQFLTLERIVLDAHSGRILGLFGVIFMDVVAILLMLLSISGIYIWIRYARSKR